MKKTYRILETEHVIRTWKVEAENEEEALSVFEVRGSVVDEKILEYNSEVIK